MSFVLCSISATCINGRQPIRAAAVKLGSQGSWQSEAVWSSEPGSLSPAGPPELWGRGWRSCPGPGPSATATAPSRWPRRARWPPGHRHRMGFHFIKRRLISCCLHVLGKHHTSRWLLWTTYHRLSSDKCHILTHWYLKERVMVRLHQR